MNDSNTWGTEWNGAEADWFATCHWDFEPYQFYESSFWVVDGEIWAATDSGCSCPSPYENHSFPGSFTKIESLKDFDEFAPIPDQPDEDSWDYEDHPRVVDSVVQARKAVEKKLAELNESNE